MLRNLRRSIYIFPLFYDNFYKMSTPFRRLTFEENFFASKSNKSPARKGQGSKSVWLQTKQMGVGRIFTSNTILYDYFSMSTKSIIFLYIF